MVHGFETANTLGDIQDTKLDEGAKLGQAVGPIHAGHPIHQVITNYALHFLKYDVLEKINFGHETADFPTQNQNDPSYHFDDCKFHDSSKRIHDQYEDIVNLLKTKEIRKLDYDQNHSPSQDASEFEFSGRNDFESDNLPDGAFAKFGEALHTIQDFYTHTNWVELEQAGYIPKGTLVDEGLGNWKILTPGGIIDNTKNVTIIEGLSDPTLKRPNNGHIVTSGENQGGLISGVATKGSFGDCPKEIALGHWDPFFISAVGGDPPLIFDSPLKIDIGTVKFSFLLGLKQLLLPYRDKNIETGLNKDDSSRVGYDRAKLLAIQQTKHEWCRLVNLVAENDRPDVVRFLFDHWVQDKYSAMNACGGAPTGKITQQSQTIDISQQSNIVIDGSQSSDPKNRPLTYSLEQVGGVSLGLNIKDSTNSIINLDLSPLKSTGFTGTLTFKFTVNNGLFDSSPVNVNVLVTNPSNSKTFMVNSNEDADPLQSGYGCGPGEKCTFPIALRLANNSPGIDTIKITQTTILDNCIGYHITDPVKIDAVIDGKPGLEITCKETESSFPPYRAGLSLDAGNSIIKGVAINGFRYGIYIDEKGGNIIQGNYLGYGLNGRSTNAFSSGSYDFGGNLMGIVITSSGNMIGGSLPNEGNVISDNGFSGVVIFNFNDDPNSVSGNILQGNYIGTGINGEATQEKRRSNEFISIIERYFPSNRISGIEIVNSNGNIIGGINPDNNNDSDGVKSCEGSCNIISGTGKISDLSMEGTGIRIYGDSSENVIQGNYIGIDKNGNTFGNILNGISIISAPEYPGKSPTKNIIGGDEKGSGNVISSNGNIGILLSETSENKISNNYIGTDNSGSKSLGNHQGIVLADSHDNEIGGNIENSGNVISGNSASGIVMFSLKEPNGSKNNIISGNYIGTSKDGLTQVGNLLDGITIINSQSNTIGGSVVVSDGNNEKIPERCSGLCNVISGNSLSGIGISGSESQHNHIGNNFIGTSINGDTSLSNEFGIVFSEGFLNVKKDVINSDSNETAGAPNNVVDSNVISGNNIDGIQISKSNENTITHNKIGPSSDSTINLGNKQNGVSIIDSSNTKITDDNIIAYNKLDGIAVVGSNDKTKGNTISSNSIYSNQVAGIDLGVTDSVNGLTPNDSNQLSSLDSDQGPNQLMNFPVGVTAYWDQNKDKTIITGIMPTSEPEKTTIDIYSSGEETKPYENNNSPTRTSQGKIYLGGTSPAANGKFLFTYEGKIPLEYVTATATNVDGSTSEFSPICGDPDKNGNPDNDNDGICDDWEISGIDMDGNGAADFVPFTANESKDHVNHKDIFIEVDHMKHHIPYASAFDLVNKSFAISPVENPDGKKGVNIYPELDEEIEHKDLISYDEFQTLKKQNFGTKDERNSPNSFNILSAKNLIFRYAFFGHERSETQFNDVTGQANIGDEDMLFTFGSARCQGNDMSCYDNSGHVVGTSSKQAINILHELGHTLGLDHGGGDSENCKPNYLSVMNYAYMIFAEMEMQTQRDYLSQDISNIVGGHYPLLPLDFSTDQLVNLDENSLDEIKGVDLYGKRFPPGLKTLYSYPQSTANGNTNERTEYDVISTGVPIDWNHNGILESSIKQDINNFNNTLATISGCSESKTSVLEGFNDWDTLQYNFRPNVFSEVGFAKNHGLSDPPNREVLNVISYLKNNNNFINTTITSATDGFGNKLVVNDDANDSNNSTFEGQNTVSSSYVKFDFTGDTSGLNSNISKFFCSLDGSQFSECSNPVEFKNLDFGTHSFKVKAIDTDGNVDFSPASFTWSVTNHLPVVNAGSDLIIDENNEFRLNGSAIDSDQQDNNLISIWKQISGKNNITIDNPFQLDSLVVSPNVTRFVDKITLELNVFDNNNGSDVDFVTFDINNINHKPIATVDPLFQNVEEGTRNIVFDGSKSFDLDAFPPDNDTLRFQWSQINGPPVLLNSTNSSAIKFDAPSMEFPDPFQFISFNLTVYDQSGATDSKRVSILINNTFANSNPGEVYAYDSQFGEGKFISADPLFESVSPRGFDYDERNNVFYVADDINQNIKKLDTNGNVLWSIFSFRPFDVAVSPDSTLIYALNNFDRTVEIYDSTGISRGSWPTYADSTKTIKIGGFDIDTDPTGDFIYVSSNSKINKYDKFGNFIKSWSVFVSDGIVEFSVSNNGNIIAAADKKIIIYDKEGNALKEIVHPIPSRSVVFDYVTVDENDNIYTSSTGKFFAKFNKDGQLLTPLDSSILIKKDPNTCGSAITDIIADPSGDFVYKLETGSSTTHTLDCIKKFKKHVPPLAIDQTISVQEIKPFSITLTSAKNNINDTITYTITTNPIQGTITNFNPLHGTLTYNPSNNFTGVDTFRFSVDDGTSKSPNRGLVTLYIGNSIPIALDQEVITQSNIPVSIQLEGLDPDVSSSGLLFAILNHPNNGRISEVTQDPTKLTAGGQNYVYTPATNFTGIDKFTFRVTDKISYSENNATVTIFVKGMDKIPIANAGSDLSVLENTRDVILTGKDSFDPDGGNIVSYEWNQIDGPPVILNDTKSKAVKFDSPSISENSVLKFNLTVTDDENSKSFDFVNVNITKRNILPIANAGPDVTIGEDQREIILSGIESFDPDGGNITGYNWTQISGPSVKFTNIGGRDLSFETPDITTNEATLKFNLTVFDNSNGQSIPDSVQLRIINTNTLPSTSDQIIITEKNIPINITLESFDENKDFLRFIIEKDSLIGKIIEQPFPVFFNSTVKEEISNGVDTLDDPLSLIKANATYTFDPSTKMLNYSLIYNGILSENDDDEETFSIYSGSSKNNGLLLFTIPLENEIHGQIGPLNNFQIEQLFDENLYTVIHRNESSSINNNITSEEKIEFTGKGIQKLTYYPLNNFTGFDEFKFKVYDGKQFSNLSKVKIEVHPLPPIPVNHEPTVSDQVINISGNSQPIIEIPSFDSDNDTISLNITNNPLFGQLSERQDLVYFKTNFTSSQEIFSNSTAQGLGLFEYNETSNILSYFFNFTGINDLGNSTLHFHKDIFDPKNIFDTLNGPIEYRLDGNKTTSGKIGPLTPTQKNNLYSGKWYLNLHTPDFPLGEIRGKILPIGITLTKIKYTPNQNFEGQDSFTFVAKDAKGTASNQGTILINVGEISLHPPIARDSQVMLNEDTSIPIQLDASDSDVNDDLTYSIESQPISGKVLSFDSSTGSLVYKPNANFNGNDGFLFKAIDQGGLESNIATVLITVNPVNDPPVANNQQVETNQNTPLQITLSGSDPIDNDAISQFRIVNNPTNGQISNFNQTSGELTYTPNSNFFGSDSFTFKVIDSQRLESTKSATISINIKEVTPPPVNNPPEAIDKTIETNNNTSVRITLEGRDIDQGDTINSFTIISNPTNGQISNFNSNTGTLTYTPNNNYAGQDSFTFKVTDSRGLQSTNVGVISITVKSPPPPNNEQPPLPLPSSVCTDSDNSNKKPKGTQSNDDLVGTSQRDTITGLGGNDRFNGCSGDDTLNGNSGNDGIAGGPDDDKLQGNEGNDYLQGDTGSDSLYGNEGNDILVGNEDRDRFFCGSGDDIILDFEYPLDVKSTDCEEF